MRTNVIGAADAKQQLLAIVLLNVVSRMVTLMRLLKTLALGILLAMGAVPPVNAQTPAAQESRYFFSVNLGGQSKEQVFNDTKTFDIYGEKGAVAAAHSIGGGTLFDIGAGARVWKSLSVGLAYSTVKNFNDATISVRVPHPLFVGQSRTATVTTTDLEHSENAIHLQFIWTIPLTSRFDISASAGPSFFTVRQTVATVQAPQDIVDLPPYTNLGIGFVSLTDVKASPVGVNVGIDGTYRILTIKGVGPIKGVGIGVGGYLRYAGASIDLPTPADMTRDTELKAGGPQGGVGLRLRF